MTQADVDDLLAGRIYVNVHTNLYGTGEIRGDVTFSSVPGEGASWSRVLALYR